MPPTRLASVLKLHPPSLRLEGECRLPVQAMQDHFSARWTLLCFSWTGGFGAPLQVIGRSMASLVVLERHLWLMLTEIKDANKVSFLDAPISPNGLFGPVVEGFAERFTEAQKASQAMQHFLPKRSSSTAASSHPKPAPTQQPAKPAPAAPPLSLPGFSRREGVPALLDATPSQSGRAPNLGWRWTPCLQRLLDLQSRKRRGPSPVAAGLPTKRPLLNLFSPH